MIRVRLFLNNGGQQVRPLRPCQRIKQAEGDQRMAARPRIMWRGVWRHAIKAYFEYRITNGYVESINGRAKMIRRIGRGCTLPLVRAKLIYGTPTVPDHSAYKDFEQETPKLRQRPSRRKKTTAQSVD